jgi:hypothetical protein
MTLSELTRPVGRVEVRIRYECANHPEVADHPGCIEHVWTTPLGKDRYRIENVPFSARGVAYQDIVRAGPQSECPCPELIEVVEPSGNGVVRVFPTASGPDTSVMASVLRHFEALGVTGEPAGPGLVALNVPPDTDIATLFRLLRAGEETGHWTYEVACDQPTWPCG